MTVSTWFEDPAFWAAMRPALFSEECVAAAGDELDAVTALVRRVGGPNVEAGARVIDMPCGVGRHCVELAQRGARVTGVDLTEAHIEIARAAAESAGVSVELILGDMRAVELPAAHFDIGLNLYTSLGYSGDPNDDMLILGKFSRALRSGGVLVIDVLGKEVLARVFEPIRYREVSGYVVREEVAIVDDWRQVRVTVYLERDGDNRVQTFQHGLYGASCLHRMLRDVGFGAVHCFGHYDGRPYDHEAERLVVVAFRASSSGPGRRSA